MKKIKIQDAIGMELCHDITEMNEGFKGVAFKRGHIITEGDISHMLAIGMREKSTKMNAPKEWRPWHP